MAGSVQTGPSHHPPGTPAVCVPAVTSSEDSGCVSSTPVSSPTQPCSRRSLQELAECVEGRYAIMRAQGAQATASTPSRETPRDRRLSSPGVWKPAPHHGHRLSVLAEHGWAWGRWWPTRRKGGREGRAVNGALCGSAKRAGGGWNARNVLS